MFKYLWILILAIPILIFMAYTAYAVWAFSVEHKNEFEDWDELFSTFEYEHGMLLEMWCAIIIATVLVLFILSLSAFGDSVLSEVSADGIH